jgi:hypothetical protein
MAITAGMEFPSVQEPFNALEFFKSTVPGSLKEANSFMRKLRKPTSHRFKVFTNKTLVANWLSINRNALFKNPESGLFRYERRFKAIAEYWLKYSVHNSACSDPNIIYGQKLWDGYIKMFVKISG